MRATNSIPDYFPVPPIPFPVGAEKFPITPSREFTHNGLILLGMFCPYDSRFEKIPGYFPG
jgi:hypothetical protein